MQLFCFSHLIIFRTHKPDRKFVLTVDADGRASAYITLHGKKSRITRIYAQALDTKWLPKVKFVQILGEDVKTKQKVYEYIYPK